MPQIFMTYDEMAMTFGGDAVSAREAAIASGLARFKGSDGVTQVRLSSALAADYLVKLANRVVAERQTDAQVAALSGIAREMRNLVEYNGTVRRAA